MNYKKLLMEKLDNIGRVKSQREISKAMVKDMLDKYIPEEHSQNRRLVIQDLNNLHQQVRSLDMNKIEVDDRFCLFEKSRIRESMLVLVIRLENYSKSFYNM